MNPRLALLRGLQGDRLPDRQRLLPRLAIGYLLEEIDNDITGFTPASFEPTIDYVVASNGPASPASFLPGRREPRRHAHEVRGGGHGDRARKHGQVLRQGAALARARQAFAPGRDLRRRASLADGLRRPGPRSRFEAILELLRGGWRSRRFTSAPRSTRGSSCTRVRRAHARRPRRRRSAGERTYKSRRHLRRRVPRPEPPTTTPRGSAPPRPAPPTRCAAASGPQS